MVNSSQHKLFEGLPFKVVVPVAQQVFYPPTKLSENIILSVLVKMDDTLRSSGY